MNYIKYLIVILFLFNFSMLQAQDLHSKITKNLRCLICQGQSVYDSDSEFANSLKLLVRNKLNEGQNEKQIYTYLKNRYGEWITYDPEFDKNTYTKITKFLRYLQTLSQSHKLTDPDKLNNVNFL